MTFETVEELRPAIEPFEWNEPPPLPAANPAWLPPLCDAHTEGAVYLWYKLVSDGRGDLDPEACGEDHEGGWPKWWRDEDDKSLDTILSPAWTHLTYQGHEFTSSWTTWGLENGIAPGQPFLVRIGKPYYSRDYYGEVDVEWDVEIVRVMPRTHAQALRAWSRALERARRYYELFIRKRDRLRHLQDTDTSAYSLSMTYYGRYNEGVRVHLDSAHHSMWGDSKQGGRTSLVSGDDDAGDYGLAFRQLIANILKHRPQVSLPAVLGLAKHRRVGITRWELLTWDSDSV